MRITGWHVERFGRLRDSGVRDLPAGLTVLHGPNAAGKTSLLEFLRRTLFGHPRGNRKGVNHYEPVDGTPWRGGRVFLDASGPVTVERYAGRGGGLRVVLPDETVAGEDALRELTGGCDDRLFAAVYAFGLAELAELGTLQDEAVRDRLLSAGVRGAGRSARAAIAALGGRADELWKPRSRTLAVDVQQAELLRLDAELAQARRTARSYPERLREEQAAEAEAERLADEERAAEAVQRRAERLLAAWPVWVRRDQAARDLAELDDVPAVRPDALERLERLTERLEATEQRLADVAHEREELSQRRGALAVDDALAAVADEVAELDADRGAQRLRLDHLAELGHRLRQACADLDQGLGDLGPGWDRDALERFDASIPARGELRGWERALADAERRVGDAERARAAAADRAVEAAADAERAQQASTEAAGPRAAATTDASDGPGGAGPPDDPALAARAEALGHLRLAVAERDRAEAELAGMDRAGAGAASWAPAAAGALAVGAAGVAAWQAALGAAAAAAGSAVLAVLLAGGALAAWRRARSGASAGRAQARQRRDAATDRASEPAAVLGLPASAGPTEVEQAAHALDRDRRERERLDRLTATAGEAAATAERAAAQHERARADVDDAVAARDALAGRWRAWCRERGLREDLDPTTAGDVVTQVARVRELRDAVAALESERDGAAATVADYAGRAARALAACGRADALPPTDPAELRAQLDAVRQLAADAAADTSARAEHVRLADRDADLAREAERLAARRQAARAEHDALLTDVGADDVATVRDLAARAQQRDRVREAVRAAEAALADQLGAGSEAAELRAELATGETAGWEAERDAAAARREERSRERDAALARLHEARRHREDLEASGRIAELERQRQSVLAERDGRVHEWRVAVLARDLVATTLEGFERERQPAVLRRAAEHLATVTAGAYRRVLQQEDDVLVTDADDQPWPVATLSRGTAEQLYLCLRLALAEDLATHRARLPFVMDDALVNFDPHRAARVAQRLATIADDTQVLYFTCHPQTVELLEDAGAAAVYDLAADGAPIPRR